MVDAVVHADWSKAEGKRAVARAVRREGRYLVDRLAQAGELADYFERWGGEAEHAVFGFDFPIGIPAAYGARAGVADFPSLLDRLDMPPWRRFREPARRREEIAATRPFYPQAPGGTAKAYLLEALRLDANSIRRRCERITRAEWLFWTLGPKQVGRAALSGWFDLLRPALAQPAGDRPVLWPFAGEWSEVSGRHRRIVVETYPGAVYPWLEFSGSGWSKRRQEDRRTMATHILGWLGSHDVAVDDPIRTTILDGFGPGPEGEDPFDAVVGLCGMLMVVQGQRPPISRAMPSDALACEGWIFGV